MNPVVSIVILSYNRKNDLLYTLETLRTIEYPPCEIIVVDNNSQDGSADAVEKNYADTTLIRLERNIGIAGWNEGFKIARGEYVFVLDDDSYPAPETISRAVDLMINNPTCGIVACRVYNLNGEYTESGDYDPQRMITFTGCGALFRSEVFVRAGMFNENFFLYQHEMDFAIRVINARYTILYDPEAVVYHKKFATKVDPHTTRLSGSQYYYNTRNTLLILLLYFPLKRILFRIFRIALGRTAFAIMNGCFIPVVKALFSFFAMSPRIWKERLIVSEDVQTAYSYGAFAGGFFSGSFFGYKKPRLLKRLPPLKR